MSHADIDVLWQSELLSSPILAQMLLGKNHNLGKLVCAAVKNTA